MFAAHLTLSVAIAAAMVYLVRQVRTAQAAAARKHAGQDPSVKPPAIRPSEKVVIATAVASIPLYMSLMGFFAVGKATAATPGAQGAAMALGFLVFPLGLLGGAVAGGLMLSEWIEYSNLRRRGRAGRSETLLAYFISQALALAAAAFIG